MTGRGREFVFTLNNWTTEQFTWWCNAVEMGFFTYVCFGQEIAPTTGTPHLQGYCQRDKKYGPMSAKALGISLQDEVVGNKCNFIVANGSLESNQVYTSKENFFEFGTPRKTKGKGRGSRSDLDDLKMAIKEGASMFQLMEDHADTVAKYPRFVHDYMRAVKESEVTIEALVPREGWQTQLVADLGETPDCRKIIWIYDLKGNIGKTYFAKHYQEKQSYYITGGKAADIFYGYNYQPVVFFDFSRMKQEYVQYDVMESFKNGQFFSTKYESKMVRFNTPHVVVFSNFYPDTSKLSEDRWDIRQIGEHRAMLF